MRTIGQLENETLAARFSDFLYVQGIESQIEQEDDGAYSLWVIEDAQVSKAADLLKEFRAAPEAAQYAKAASDAGRQREREERADQKRRSTLASEERLTYERQQVAVPWLPVTLIVACVAMAVYSRMGEDFRALLPFFISNIRFREIIPPEVVEGQVWRLITPIFIHYGPMHILFNMMWLFDLGKFIQERFSSLYLALFILGCGIVSNLAQYWWDGPVFGGMSGVNYALFGFLWIRGKFDPRAGWQLHATTVQTMLLWFVLCFTPLIPHVANAAHFGGLLAGGLWGFLTSGRLKFSR